MRTRHSFEPVLHGSGQLVGDRYELGRLLGCGGMSNVYRARDAQTGRAVAVKIFRPGLEFADAQRRREREVAVLSSLRHDGLVAVLDADIGEEQDGLTYLVVELVDGPTLRRHLSDHPLVEDEVAALGSTLCSALAYIHGRGIVHRDIKPANILLAAVGASPDLGPKLADFGTARVIDDTRMTADGLTVGTANYLSPEQVGAAEVGPPSDVYSIGLVLIEALTGTVVYPGTGVEAALARLHRPPAVPGWIGAGLAQLLAAMTAHDPDRRPSAAAAASALADIADHADTSLDSDLFAFELPVAGRGPVAVRPGRTRARLRFGLLATAAASVAGLMLSGAVLAEHGSDPGDQQAGALAPASTSAPAASPSVSPPSTGPAPTPVRASGSHAPNRPDAVEAKNAMLPVRSSAKHRPAATPRSTATRVHPLSARARAAQARARAAHARTARTARTARAKAAHARTARAKAARARAARARARGRHRHG